MLGQTGIQPVIGEADIEYVETLDGRHIILDHLNKTGSCSFFSTVYANKNET